MAFQDKWEAEKMARKRQRSSGTGIGTVLMVPVTMGSEDSGDIKRAI